jgi:hypothetical protein
MLERFGFRAKALERIRMGNLRLGDLPLGHWRQLVARDIHAVIPSAAEGSRGSIFNATRRDRSTSLRMTKRR